MDRLQHFLGINVLTCLLTIGCKETLEADHCSVKVITNFDDLSCETTGLIYRDGIYDYVDPDTENIAFAQCLNGAERRYRNVYIQNGDFDSRVMFVRNHRGEIIRYLLAENYFTICNDEYIK